MKKTLFAASLLFCLSVAYGQEARGDLETALPTAEERTKAENDAEKEAESADGTVTDAGKTISAEQTVNRTKKARPDVDFIFAFTPAVIFNIDSSRKSAPSPVVYTFGVGIYVPADMFVSLQPPHSVFYNN